MMQNVILVNENDEATGTADKMEAHQKGWLHRAFSIFVFNGKGEMLIQQRALGKYHSGGLWTNACCSHPRPGEKTDDAARRRLKEELGFETSLTEIFDFVYKAEFVNGLAEFEYDHVYVGEYDGIVRADTEEVMGFCFRQMAELTKLIKDQPEDYTAWFRIAFPKIEEWWNAHYNKRNDGV
jgi:isopentenyl-diphosphate delta-isomerase